ncbi:MAG TPA: S8 family serine peptidase, partial [Pirellulales bacterium]|nr:S8 family serine peptidase [Pirellulales bacterium]
DGTIDGSESLLEGWFVFLDQNQNGTLDATETALQTDSSGAYLFENLPDDTYYVTEILPDGWEQTLPSGSAKLSTIPLGPIQIVGGELFATDVFSTDVQSNWIESIDASAVSIYPLGTCQQLGSDVSLASVQSAALMNADDFRTDPLFVGFDGTGFATVIIDSGADLNHPFFGTDADSNGVSDRIVYQYDFGNDDTDANDVNGHGTNVAGIAASSDSTYTGTAPGADIIVLKVFADSGSGSFFDVEDALQWVVTNATTYNIASINMSLGDGGTYDSPFSAEMLSDELASLVAMDVMVISAAGNEFTTAGTEGISYPAADISSLAVSAVWDTDNGGPWNWSGGTTDYTTAADRVTSFSSRSSTWTDIFAPGAYITNAGLSGGVSSMGGTSQAAPQVAGIATVAQQLATATLGRRLTQAEFRSLMQSTGVTINDGDDEDDNVTNTGADYSRVDMWALMRGILATASTGAGVHTTTIVSENTVSNINFGNRLSTGSRPPLIATEAAPGIPTSHVTASSAVIGSTATVSALSVHQSSGADARIVDDSSGGTGQEASNPADLPKELYPHRLAALRATQPDRPAVPRGLDAETLSSWVDSMFAEQQPVQVASAFETEPVGAAASATGGEAVDQLLGKKDLFDVVDDVVDSWLATGDASIAEQDACESELSPLQEEALDIFRA